MLVYTGSPDSKVGQAVTQLQMLLNDPSLNEKQKARVEDMLAKAKNRIQMINDAKVKTLQNEIIIKAVNEKHIVLKKSLVSGLQQLSTEKSKLSTRKEEIASARGKSKSMINSIQMETNRKSRMDAQMTSLTAQVKDINLCSSESSKSLKQKSEQIQLLFQNSPKVLKKKNEENVIKELQIQLEKKRAEEEQLTARAAFLDNEIKTATDVPFSNFVYTSCKKLMKLQETKAKMREAEMKYKKKNEEYQLLMSTRMNNSRMDIMDASMISDYDAMIPSRENSQESANNGSLPPVSSVKDVLAAKQHVINSYVEQQAENVDRNSNCDEQEENGSEEPIEEDEEQQVEEEQDEHDENDENGDVSSNDMEVESSDGDVNKNEGIFDDVNETAEEEPVEGEYQNEAVNTKTPSQETVTGERRGSQNSCEGGYEDEEIEEEVEEDNQDDLNRTEEDNERPQSTPVSQISNTMGLLSQSTPMEISQSNNVEEAGAGLSDLFAVSQTDNADDFNAANVLNISVNSNDPGGDFLNLVSGSKSSEKKDGADFSFSLFGGGDNGGSGDNNDFNFNFGGASPQADASAFNLNFGDSEDNAAGNGGDDFFSFKF